MSDEWETDRGASCVSDLPLPARDRGSSAISRRRSKNSKLEFVLQRELPNTRSSSVLTPDGSEAGAAAERVRDAWVVQNGVVQDVEILHAELQVGFAENRESADQGAIPDRVAGAAERILTYIAEAGSGTSVEWDRVSRRVDPALAGRRELTSRGYRCRTIASEVLGLKVSRLGEIALPTILQKTGRRVIGAHINGKRIARVGLNETGSLPAVQEGTDDTKTVVDIRMRPYIGDR